MRVVIIIEDMPNGRVSTQFASRPNKEGRDEESPASQLAARVADFIQEQTEFATQAEADAEDRDVN